MLKEMLHLRHFSSYLLSWPCITAAGGRLTALLIFHLSAPIWSEAQDKEMLPKPAWQLFLSFTLTVTLESPFLKVTH